MVGDDDDDVKTDRGILVVLYSLGFQEMKDYLHGRICRHGTAKFKAKRCRCKQGLRPRIRYEM